MTKAEPVNGIKEAEEMNKNKKNDSGLFYGDVSIKNLILTSGEFTFEDFFGPIIKREKEVHRREPFININRDTFTSQVESDKNHVKNTYNISMCVLKKDISSGVTSTVLREKNNIFFYKEGLGIIRQLLLNGELDETSRVSSFILRSSFLDEVDKNFLGCGVSAIDDYILYDQINIRRYYNGQLRIYFEKNAGQEIAYSGTNRFFFKD